MPSSDKFERLATNNHRYAYVSAFSMSSKTVSGKSGPNAKVPIYLSGSLVTTVTANASGQWNYVFDTAPTVGQVITVGGAIQSAPFVVTDSNLPVNPSPLISTQAALVSALATATGGQVLRLASSGSPYSIAVENLAPTSELKIVSDDPLVPATIDIVAKAGSGGGILSGWKNVTFENIKFDRTALNYTARQQFVPNIHLNAPDTVKVINCIFKGRATARWPGDTNPDSITKGDMGIRFVSPKNCVVSGNSTDGYGFWLQATGDGQDNNTYSNNNIRRSQFDGMQFIGGGNGLTITGNDISDLLGSINNDSTDSGNHDDLIQIATSGSATGWDNISVLRNFLDGGGKDTPQGIFVKDEDLKGIRSLTISDNAIRNSQANGIGVNANSGPGISATIANNLVLWSAVPHDPVDAQITQTKPFINLTNGVTGTASNNLSSGYAFTGSTVTQTANVTINYTDTANVLYAENILPGSLATGVDKYRVREAMLPVDYVAGPSIIKRSLSLQANRFFGLSAGQSNQEYFYTNSRMEFQSALNDNSPAAVSYTFGNGATEGSALLDVNKPAYDSARPERVTYYWWNEGPGTPGPRYDKWSAAVDAAVAAGRRVDFTIWNQGEGDAFFIGASDAQATRYFNARALLFATMRAKVPGLRIFLAPMNRRDVDYSALTANYIGGIEKIRDFDPVYAAANPSFCTILPEMYDQPGDGGAHSVDAGYDTLAIRFARKIAKTYGYTVSGGVDGPRLIAAARNGTTVVFEFAHDGGTALTPASANEGLRYAANGTAIALSNISVTDATHVTATLASTPANGATEVAEFGYGTLGTIVWQNMIRDNQTVPLPVRHGKVTPTVNAAADTTPPVITSPATGTTANNTAYTTTLTANEPVTFSKRTGDQTANFTLTQATVPSTTATLTFPATTTAGTNIANLRATDAATTPNVTDFTHTLTVNAATANISSVWSNPLFNRKASVNNGQTLQNQIAAPADSSTQTAYDAFLGSSTSTGTDDPTFVAASGGVPAYFRNDGGDSIQTVSTDFLKTLSLNKSWSYAMLIKAPSVWTAGTVPVLFGAGANVASNPGIQARYVVNNNQIRIATADGSTGPSVNLTATLPTSGYIMVAMTYDASTKTLTFYINSTTSLTVPATTSLNGGTATSNFLTGSALSDGAGWIEDVMSTGIKTSTDVGALRDYWQTQYGITIF